MTTYYKTIEEIINENIDTPIPVSVIPNYMGINLSSVDALSWQRLNDGQLTNLMIYFTPKE